MNDELYEKLKKILEAPGNDETKALIIAQIAQRQDFLTKCIAMMSDKTSSICKSI